MNSSARANLCIPIMLIIATPALARMDCAEAERANGYTIEKAFCDKYPTATFPTPSDLGVSPNGWSPNVDPQRWPCVDWPQGCRGAPLDR